jgi:hypothetical protein
LCPVNGVEQEAAENEISTKAASQNRGTERAPQSEAGG